MAENVLTKRKMFSNRDLFKLFSPLVVEQFLEYLVGLIASIMAALVGESAVSGVSLVEFVMALLISIFTALATGGAVIIGQYLGKKQMEKAKDAANQLVWFAGIMAAIILNLAAELKGDVYLKKTLKYRFDGKMIKQIVCRIALSYVFGIYFHMGMLGTWIAMFIDWLVKAVIFIWRYLSGKWTAFQAIK